jgi:hypothetical protein
MLGLAASRRLIARAANIKTRGHPIFGRAVDMQHRLGHALNAMDPLIFQSSFCFTTTYDSRSKRTHDPDPDPGRAPYIMQREL